VFLKQTRDKSFRACLHLFLVVGNQIHSVATIAVQNASSDGHEVYIRTLPGNRFEPLKFQRSDKTWDILKLIPSLLPVQRHQYIQVGHCKFHWNSTYLTMLPWCRNNESSNADFFPERHKEHLYQTGIRNAQWTAQVDLNGPGRLSFSLSNWTVKD
jgi:hypothetical protein